MESRTITLNFLPLENEDFTCRVFRRRREADDEPRPAEGMRFERFEENGRQVTYWLALEELDGFQPVEFSSSDHRQAATWVLSHDIPACFAEALPDPVVHRGKAIGRSFDVVLRQHPEGNQVMNCEMTWRSQCNRHGMLLDFRFRSGDDVPFSKRLQQLSLSLDDQGRSNRNYYRDKHEWMETFIGRRIQIHAPTLALPHVAGELRFAPACETVRSRVLEKREYSFSGAKTHTSQYWGIQRHGVLESVPTQPTVYFVFRRRDIGAARFLYRCLHGDEFPDRFSGMEKFFGFAFNNENVRHIEVDGMDLRSFERVAAQIAEEAPANPLCVVVTDGDPDGYYAQKAVFLQSKLPSQDVTVEKIALGKGFQWAVAGIGLQMFCKAGGIPWRVNTRKQDTLIVGLSQVWDRNEDGIDRYVAYSVLTDSSGIFRDIETLVDAHNENDYVQQLGHRIRAALQEYAGQQDVRQVVLHCSFRLRRDAMRAIRNAVEEASVQHKNVRFIVMRVNTGHSYFGYDVGFASCVPYECSYIRLGYRDYLAWFEGAGWDKPVVVGRVACPLRVTFDYPDDLKMDEEEELLQDLANLSGANWRGFNAKATPVSVFYCDLVGDFVKEFSKRGLPVPDLKEFKPWFL